MIKKKPANTKYFTYYNANPRNIRATDCLLRALSVALNKPWETVYEELYEIGRKQGRLLNEKEVYKEYLERNGWVKLACPKKGCTNKRLKGTEFVKVIQKYKIAFPIVIHIGTRHIVCIKDGKLLDTWNSSGRAVGNVWVHKDNKAIYDKVAKEFQSM